MTKAAYLGCFAHQLDRQGRVMLPAQWRGAGEAFSFHLVKTPAPHIVATAAADAAEPDSAGRITISDEIRRAAGIEQETVLVGMLDTFELWSPSVYSAQTERPVKEESLRLV